MINIAGKRMVSLTEEEKRKSAEMAGVSCIRLRWKDYIDTDHGVMGFQSVVISKIKRGAGRQQVDVRWSKNIDNKDCPAGQLNFYRDEMDIGIAYLPDSPYNRNKLAYQLLDPNTQWIIDDKKVLAEIQQLSEEIKGSKEYRDTLRELENKKMEVRLRLEREANKGDKTAPDEDFTEVEVLKRRIIELEAKNEKAILKKKIDELEAKKTFAEQKKTDMALEGFNPPFSVADFRAIARKQIHRDHDELVEEMKKASPKGYTKTDSYIEKIKPLVDKRVEELKLEYSAASNDN